VVSPSQQGVLMGVFEGIREACVAEHVDSLACLLINETLEKSLSAYGFMRREPTRFLLVSPQRVSAETRQRLLSASNWLITMGDSDIDRPWDAGGDRVQIRMPKR
jgi:hypothetical protein